MSYNMIQVEDGMPPSGYLPQGNPSSILTGHDLAIGTVINTVDQGSIEGSWQLGGRDITARGDQVVWGYFYADPNIMSWGSRENPDVFVKIWYDFSGAVFVDFFHVSVPDIDVHSALPYDSAYDQQGTTILANRFVEHRYWLQPQGPVQPGIQVDRRLLRLRLHARHFSVLTL